jgi:two-component system cell cycle sensor histidine kinase PleC
MAPRRSTTADKNIVDRTKARRNADVARTVRETRDRLAQQPGSPAFDREMLKLHARALMGSAVVVPLLTVVVALAGLFAGMGVIVILWAALTAAVHAGLAYYAQKVSRTAAGDIDVASVRMHFLVIHGATGLCWAWFAGLGCDSCQIDQFPIIKAVILLLAISATAILAYALRGALIATFGLPVVAYVALAVQLWLPVEAVMAGLLAASLPFFSYVSSHLHRSTVMLLSFRTEKDGLIAELETANAISDEARRRAEEANLAKSRFLASMSHELRTPLNAILGFSEVMAKEVLGPLQNETYREYARDIHSSGEHLLDLINEILDISRIEAGRYQLNEEFLSLSDTVEDCCHLVELKARAADHAQPSLQRHQVRADRRRGARARRLDRRRRPVHRRQGQRAGHPRRRDPGRALGLRPGLHRHQERRTGHRPRPAHRPGPARHPWRPAGAALQDARGHGSLRDLPGRARDAPEDGPAAAEARRSRLGHRPTGSRQSAGRVFSARGRLDSYGCCRSGAPSRG